MKHIMAIKRLKDDELVCLHSRLIMIYRSTCVEYRCVDCEKELTEVEVIELIRQGASKIDFEFVVPDEFEFSQIG